ncbi:DUF4235 domain-containing protein [Halomonas denitrificans]|nr:DUF4235 domain-containing protein [Halomonas denitrificans]
MSSLSRKLLLAMAVFGAGRAVKSALDASYEKTTGEPPPKNPAAKDVGWTEALVWSGLLGLAAGLTRTTVRRAAAGLNDGEPVKRRR